MGEQEGISRFFHNFGNRPRGKLPANLGYVAGYRGGVGVGQGPPIEELRTPGSFPGYLGLGLNTVDILVSRDFHKPAAM